MGCCVLPSACCWASRSGVLVALPVCSRAVARCASWPSPSSAPSLSCRSSRGSVIGGRSSCVSSGASVAAQRGPDVAVEHWIVDGGSTDGSLDIIKRYLGPETFLLTERDHGPADAINKGLRCATGEFVAWLNADDLYEPGALARAAAVLAAHPRAALAFGHCRIVDEGGAEIRNGITRFKELFFPLSSHFTIQCINYISQPAMFFRRAALEHAGLLRTDLTAAWDYEFTLRLWRQGGAMRIPGGPLADFRWHPGSISGRAFAQQFREEWHAAADDAGRWSPQALIHLGVRFGIVGIYSLMAAHRKRKA
ncbi:MAG: glycosyltransferase family 2 protein [Kiritimatiellaeota bacterium]|nr:glycosyltransferase family 2 protein [Kiritimatiellota bacterium]